MSRPAVDPAPIGSALDRTGAELVPGALGPDLLERLTGAVRTVERDERRARGLADDAPLHLLEFLDRDPAFLELVDHPATLPVIVSALGWNVHLYHSHLDVHPPAPPGPTPWRWHQDGYRQNLDMEAPRPRLSVKVAFFLSDCSTPDRGNLLVIPESHVRDSLPRPADLADAPSPAGAQPVLARPGDALVFDRRLWHARSDNRSHVTRVVLFCAYTHRWIRARGAYPQLVGDERLPPVRRQLLGAATSPLGYWDPTPTDVPLRPV